MLPRNGLYGHIRANTFRSLMLLAGFALLVCAYWWAGCLAWSSVAYLVDFTSRPLTAVEAYDVISARATERAWALWYVPLVVTGAWFTLAWIFHAAIIRAATGAEAVSRRHSPRLHASVERLAIAAGLPMPRVEIVRSRALNAYAAGLGPSDATIAVTQGLLDALSPRELEAVLAHEMVHIRNRDVRLMVVAHIFAGGITLLGNFVHRIVSAERSTGWSVGVFESGGSWTGGHEKPSGLGAPAAAGVVAALLVAAVTLALTHVAAILSRLAISRAREMVADAGAVELTKDADALISALIKISGHDYVPGASDTMPAMMISSGFDRDDFVEALFSTHPPVEVRIAALRRYAGGRLPSSARVRPNGLTARPAA
ncbi:MAG: M48 family metalloprotease [Hyphomicrobiaceae bacterium]